MALTDVKCRGAKAGKVRQKLSDGGGLQLWIQPNGSRLWQLIYQYQGKQAQMALGPYPQVSLLDAQTKRNEVKGKIREGIDPGGEKRLDATNLYNTAANWTFSGTNTGYEAYTQNIPRNWSRYFGIRFAVSNE